MPKINQQNPTATLNRLPGIGEVTSIINYGGEQITGKLIRTYNGTQPGEVRAVVRCDTKLGWDCGLLGYCCKNK